MAVAINIQNEKTVPSSSGGYIQSLIDNASPGDTINIPSGTYNEDITIDIRINLIGENREDTIIIGTGNHHTVQVTADNVKISGFTIKNCFDAEWYGGIGIYSNNNEIKDNILTENENGIVMGSMSEQYKGSTIKQNLFIDNSRHGIVLVYTKDCTIYDNTIYSNSRNGMRVLWSYNTDIIGNTITYNSNDGMSFWDSHYTLVDNNEISHNSETGIFSWTDSSTGTFQNNNINFNGLDGVFIDQSYQKGDFLVKGNIIRSNGRNGVRIQFSRANTVQNNEIVENKHGVYLLGANNNDIIINNFTGNEYGVLIKSDYECSILNEFYYNNFRGNIVNAHDECSNIWHNLAGGKGNYWDDYKGSDSNNDGIGDTPYEIEGGSNKDNYPLMDPYNNHSRVKSRNFLRFLQNILSFLNLNKLIRR